MDKTETIKRQVESFSTDFQRKLNIESLGDNILNCAELHASKRGFGLETISPRDQAWVLSRLSIEITEMPNIFNDYQITTWIESIYRLFTNRNFVIHDGNGKVFGYARSIWAMIDRNTREPLELEHLYGDIFSNYLFPEKNCPIKPMARIKPLGDTIPVKEYEVVASDIDYNIHLNSIQYIRHIYDLFSLDYLKEHTLKRIDIAYINETVYGDILDFYKQEIDHNSYVFEVKKHSKEIVVRGLISFC